jgi:hypothetical protein|tara:strand:- start:2 stop:814 length:813 start_codon:yes stop_codon:yes gene_type:complete
MTNKNFLRFMGYQKQAHTVTANQAHGSGHTDVDEAGPLTVFDGSGDDFGPIALLGTDGTDIIVTVTAVGNNADGRGTNYTKDAVTGATFAGFSGNTDTHDVAAGDVTRLHSADVTVADAGATLEIAPVSSGVGYDLVQNDIVTVYSYLGAGDADTKILNVSDTVRTAVASKAFNEANGILVPAANYLGADPISATTTRLSFKSLTGTAADDDIVLEHGSGKFKAVCEMMEAALNADRQGSPIVMTDIANGIVPFSGQFNLGITKCIINNA